VQVFKDLNAPNRAIDLAEQVAIKRGERAVRTSPQSASQSSLIGFLDKDELKRFELIQKAIPFAVALGFVWLRAIFPGASIAKLIAVCLVGYGVGLYLKKVRVKALVARYIASLEFHLPIVMERLVMAVQSGLDILAAIKVLVELERDGVEAGEQHRLDPLTKLLELVLQLTESGLSFDQALEEVVRKMDCTPLRHAFIHLAVAYKEGGELVMPLTELSDTSQLYYQESVEEVIAKMPVKATFPLLCTFAGLILCFITPPLMQVLQVLSGASLK